MSAKIILSARAELDVPGETRRQVHVFGVWLVCLALAVALAVVRKPPGSDEASRADGYRRERLAIAAGVGIAMPALLTWWLTYRRRRGGAHARGIVVDITRDGELRIWGRGYGQRALLEGADVSERLVDVYSGRLGAWRQRRLTVRGQAIPGMPGELSLATPADDADDHLDLPLHGGEGDCIELARTDYLRVAEEARRLARTK